MSEKQKKIIWQNGLSEKFAILETRNTLTSFFKNIYNNLTGFYKKTE